MPRIIIHLPDDDRTALATFLAMSPEDRIGHPLVLTELDSLTTTKAGTMIAHVKESKRKATQMALPLPPPSPAVGQVWVWLGWPWSSPARIGERQTVTEVLPDADYGHAWPPEGAMLVAGPGAPWRPFVEVVDG